MSGFFKKPKQGASTGSTLTPNVGQYGWTLYESQSVSQIIGFVNEAKGYAVDAATSANSARESAELALTYVNLAKEWAGKSEVSYNNAKEEADRAERYANQSVDIYNAFLNVAANQRILEIIDLKVDQTDVTFNKIMADAAFVSVNGQRIDSCYLVKEIDYTVAGISKITLKRRYPLGTKLSAVQDIKKDESVPGVSESAAIWNRKFINFQVGVNFVDYNDNGRDVTPRLVFEGGQYLPLYDSSEAVVFNKVPVKQNNGDILIETTKGNRLFSRNEAEAVARKDIKGVEITSESATTARSINSHLSDKLTLLDFGAKGNGIANEDHAITAVGDVAKTAFIDGLGKTYLVSAIPAGKYVNGFWKVGDVITGFEFVNSIRAGDNVVAIGNNAATTSTSDDFIAIGKNAGAAATTARNCIAIGKGAMLSNEIGRHNIAIGLESLRTLNGVAGDSFAGTRNIGIGGNAGRFVSTGNRNIMLGRDVAHGLTTGGNNIILGNSAMMGDGPNSLDPGVIINQTPLEGNRNVLLGTEAGKHLNANDTVMVGFQAGLNVVDAIGTVAIGHSALSNLQSDKSFWGKTQQIVNVDCTYSQAGNETITIAKTSHGLTTGFKVLLRFTSGLNSDVTFSDDIWFDVTVTDSNNFTIQSPVSSTASGNAKYTKISTNTTYTKKSGECVGIGREVGNGTDGYRSVGVGDRVAPKGLGTENIGIGAQVFYANTPGGSNVAVGTFAQQNAGPSATGNVAIGSYSMIKNTAGTNNVAVGISSLREITTGTHNVAIGSSALYGTTTNKQNTAIGTDAMRYISGTTDAHNFVNCSGLGYQAAVTGNNQIQLGNSATTVYVHGTVQNRSDARDKVDVEDTPLGIDFINGLRPVHGRWDLRDDYFETVKSVNDKGEEVTTRVAVEKDGSRARTRKHQWFIAQEVKELCDKMGVEFGGYQDHKVEGGADVLSLGYDEFIPPITKAIQDCWSRMDELEARLDKAGL